MAYAVRDFCSRLDPLVFCFLCRVYCPSLIAASEDRPVTQVSKVWLVDARVERIRDCGAMCVRSLQVSRTMMVYIETTCAHSLGSAMRLSH